VRIVVRLMLRLVLLVILLVALVLGVTAARVWRAGETDEARKADALVVLGAAQYDGRPQEFLTARLEHAKRLYDDGTAPRILTLGGKRPGDRFTEADAGSGSWSRTTYRPTTCCASARATTPSAASGPRHG
jgi:vancomycin permeability regulator SanA